MWIFVIAIFLGLCYASLLYIFNKKQHYGKTLTILLFILRCFATSLLVTLFFNPSFKVKSTSIEKSTIIVAQDNSTSLILTKDSSFYKNNYPHLLDSLTDNLSKKYTVDKYLFGNKTREFDSIDYQDYYTDINDVLKNIKKNYYKKNVGAVVLLSDGICNKSYFPEQDIESYPFPIYTVTLGDTTNYPDLYIKDIIYNKTAPSNTMTPIRVVANANNCRNEIMNIKVVINNDIAKEIEIPINSSRFSNTIDLNIETGDEGVKQIDIEINNIKGELTTNNNKKRIFIDVTDKQYKALFFAKSPHPDLGSLRNVLGDNFETDMIFSGEELPDFKNYDIIFLHQVPFPGMENQAELNKQLKENKEIPVFFIIGESTDLEAFNSIQSSIELNKGAVNSVLDIKANYNNTFGIFNIDNELIEAINIFPPLSLPHLEFTHKTSHDILLHMNIKDVSTQSPLLSFSTDNEGRKNAFLFGTGIWRWKLYDFHNNEVYDNFEELFSKSVKYLLTEKDKELIINHKESYFNNEPIHFTADLKNPSQELTNEPDLRMRIIDKHSKKVYEYDFAKNENSYYLNINSLPVGIYNFTAEAQLGNSRYLEKGSFSIVSVGAEAQDLVANSQRMKLLASLTNGKNFNVEEMNQLVESIDNDDRITSITREETNYQDLINMKLIFFVILSLVSIEWFLRKMFGTY
ncbi:MAG: hypothetical protein J6Q39_06855 [Bacteroidales bacterium]|nr:hypothetical protein [Bacteroidales bacterium]